MTEPDAGSGEAEPRRRLWWRAVKATAFILVLVVAGEVLGLTVGTIVAFGSFTWPRPDRFTGGPNGLYFAVVWSLAAIAYAIAWWRPAGRIRDMGLLAAAVSAHAAFASTSGPLHGSEAVVGAAALAAAAPRVSWRYGIALVILVFVAGLWYASWWPGAVLLQATFVSTGILVVGFAAKLLWLHFQGPRMHGPVDGGA